MPYVCSECGTKLDGAGGARCGACGLELATNPPRNATADPEVVDEFPTVSVWSVKGVTKHRLPSADRYALDVTREAMILIRTSKFLWYKSAIREMTNTSVDIFGSAISTYYLNKPFTSPDMEDVTPKDRAGNPLPAMEAFRSDPRNNRMIPIADIISVGLRDVVSKKGNKSLNARISYRDGPSKVEGYALIVPVLDGYTSQRFKRLVSGLDVQALEG